MPDVSNVNGLEDALEECFGWHLAVPLIGAVRSKSKNGGDDSIDNIDDSDSDPEYTKYVERKWASDLDSDDE